MLTSSTTVAAAGAAKCREIPQPRRFGKRGGTLERFAHGVAGLFHHDEATQARRRLGKINDNDLPITMQRLVDGLIGLGCDLEEGKADVATNAVRDAVYGVTQAWALSAHLGAACLDGSRDILDRAIDAPLHRMPADRLLPGRKASMMESSQWHGGSMWAW